MDRKLGVSSELRKARPSIRRTVTRNPSQTPSISSPLPIRVGVTLRSPVVRLTASTVSGVGSVSGLTSAELPYCRTKSSPLHTASGSRMEVLYRVATTLVSLPPGSMAYSTDGWLTLSVRSPS